MKINDKNLSYFATCPPVDYEGYLMKRGDVNKSWQRRFFVLKGNLLFYFEKRGEREPIGVIILEGCTIEMVQEGELYCFQIKFHGINNRTYCLSAESQEIMEQWMKNLTCAGYEYMKVMVAELQRQLQEMDKAKDASPNNAITSDPPKPPPRRQNPFNHSRPAPPIPTHATSSAVQAANGNGKQSMPISSPNPSQSHTNRLPPKDKSAAQLKEFTFQAVHDAFGREINQDLQERRRLKELAQRPLIEI